MEKRLYIQPLIEIEDIEEQDGIMATGSNDPDIVDDVVIPEEEGADWGDGENDI